MAILPVLFPKSYALSLTTVKNPGVLVQALRDIQAKNMVYTYSQKEGDPAKIQFMSAAQLATLIAALNPASSLPILVNTTSMPMQPFAVRMDEFYHIITGISEFAGTDPNGEALNDTPVQIKMKLSGRVAKNALISVVAAGGSVTAGFPIASASDVSATKPGGSLTVTSIVNPNLGVVALNDGVSPVADGVVVSLSYPTIRHCVVQLTDPAKKVVAVAVSQELVDYLSSNT